MLSYCLGTVNGFELVKTKFKTFVKAFVNNVTLLTLT